MANTTRTVNRCRRSTARSSYDGIAGLMVAGAMLTFAGEARAQVVLPNDAKQTCTVTPEVFATWFKSGRVAANAEVVPANSLEFPDVPNCSFYQWSEQMFLWLTSPTPNNFGGGGSRIFNSAAFFDVLVLPSPQGEFTRMLRPHKNNELRELELRASQFGPHGMPVIIDKAGQMFDVLPSLSLPGADSSVIDKSGKLVQIAKVTNLRGKPILVDKTGKPIDMDMAVNFRPQDMQAASEKAGALFQSKADVRSMPTASARFIKSLRAANIARRFVVNGKSVFLDANGEIIDVDQGQAFTDGVLLAQNKSLVYFATMVNDVFAYLRTGQKNGGISPAPTGFPTTQLELARIVEFAQAHERVFPAPEALAVEVKTSWVEATGLDSSKYVTITATIPEYDMSSQTKWTFKGQKTATLAMVGMHVVGSVKGHPEMIWATFEHVDNAPNDAYGYLRADDTTVPVPQSTAGKWLFSATSASEPFNNQRMSYDKDERTITALGGGNTIGPTNTIRRKAWGAASGSDPNPLANSARSNSDIISINNSVIRQLADTDVRKNYVFIGATWTVGGAPPSAANQVGTSRLSNTTMETYTQGATNKSAGRDNCFACHKTNSFPVSHIFEDIQPLFPPSP